MSDVRPAIATMKPFYREMKAGQRALWCACGLSKRQPFCDGRSHVGTGIEPVQYRAERDEEVLLCGCKQTGTPPFCDGTHSNLPGGYKDEAAEAAFVDLPVVAPDADGFARLDGECFVVTPRLVAGTGDGGYRIRTLVSPALGARHQSQFHIALDAGTSPVLASPDGDVILWVVRGGGTIEIGGRLFPVAGDSGIYIRRDEPFRLSCDGTAMDIYASVCPGGAALETRDAMTDGFDDSCPVRVSGIDEASRHAMGPRYFQMLVTEEHGLRNSAQFVGHIPKSKAEMHRHLYEEALIILSGEGMIWNESRRARVAAGDVIFFPRKHVHSLQSVSEDGMDVVGLIHPGTNPGINFY
jgi:mannose-6-phosphate isomerase-like protein (cupin superfamily)/CDGSH-type Zn-finger protein